MRYTMLGNTGLEVSVLGFGCMRFPEKDGKVIRDLSTPLLRRAVELGVNYFDTAIGYCSGDSQSAVGEALEGVRDKVILSTKNHHHRAGKAEWRRHRRKYPAHQNRSPHRADRGNPSSVE